ncbi:MAG: hypothetical protein EOP00_02445 [Pedobacter sp.]|nr:MAG: hypothetical protein EOP00_02445 [Pedobacter sp.]
MKKYARISCAFTATGAATGLDEDNVVSTMLNDKLEIFIQKNKVKDYRIIHSETTIVPDGAFTSGYNLVSLHLEYQV